MIESIALKVQMQQVPVAWTVEIDGVIGGESSINTALLGLAVRWGDIPRMVG